MYSSLMRVCLGVVLIGASSPLHAMDSEDLPWTVVTYQKRQARVPKDPVKTRTMKRSRNPQKHHPAPPPPRHPTVVEIGGRTALAAAKASLAPASTRDEKKEPPKCSATLSKDERAAPPSYPSIASASAGDDCSQDIEFFESEIGSGPDRLPIWTRIMQDDGPPPPSFTLGSSYESEENRGIDYNNPTKSLSILFRWNSSYFKIHITGSGRGWPIFDS